jgi:hypothetical protein
VIARLGKCEREVARKQVWLDFAFLVLYPLAISLACALLGDYLGGKAGLVGLMAAWAVLIAGPLDAVENLAILTMLGNGVSAPWPQLSTICAALKFTLALGGIGYVALAGAGVLICRLYG